jgi:glutamine amidotransferase
MPVAGRAPVAIIDGGGANIASLRFALERLGRDSVLTTDAATIRAADHVILPGVGAARAAMDRLRASGLDRLIPALNQPVLGICLGMQLLFDASEEENTPCLGIIPGTARRFENAPDRPVPHMGWNQLERTAESALLAEVPDGAYCYFVHSYALPVTSATVAQTQYGWPFSAVVARGNFVATQFHPERSGEVGARILGNFLSRC